MLDRVDGDMVTSIRRRDTGGRWSQVSTKSVPG
jgi:hypothetical protein